MTESESGAGSKTLGLERWVQFAFIAGALFLFWLLDNVIWTLWDSFALVLNVRGEPDETMVTGGAAVLAIVISFACYRSVKVNQWAHEVAGELSKVTWPSRKETWSATVVVLIVSLIAAVILGVFDTAWSAVTDLIYI